MLIGELVERTGLNRETVRFYERRGLLDPARRDSSGYRRYDEASLARVRFIRRAQSLGLSLREIAGLIDLTQSPRVDCAEVCRRASVQLDEVERQLAALVEMRARLQSLIARCGEDETAGQCAIITDLNAT